MESVSEAIPIPVRALSGRLRLPNFKTVGI